MNIRLHSNSLQWCEEISVEQGQMLIRHWEDVISSRSVGTRISFSRPWVNLSNCGHEKLAISPEDFYSVQWKSIPIKQIKLSSRLSRVSGLSWAEHVWRRTNKIWLKDDDGTVSSGPLCAILLVKVKTQKISLYLSVNIL